MKKIVIGLGFGDEGKGLVTDWLAQKTNYQVIRYSGGHQVGHCVRRKNEQHIFSNFGSGTIHGSSTIWNAKTCDPVAFCKEHEDIKQYNPKIKINSKCAVTTPFEKTDNIKKELKNNHGSMGCGFGSTIEREEDNYHLYFNDIFYPEILEVKFDSIRRYYASKGIHVYLGQEYDFFTACEKMSKIVSQDLREDSDVIYESSQGLMLDMDYGVFPNVTRSKVGTQEIDISPSDRLYLVTRSYQTRHGNGWCSPHNFKPYAPTETNHYNQFQGQFKTMLLDIDTLNYAINIDDKIRDNPTRRILIITCLDHLNKQTGYAVTHKGNIVEFDKESDFLSYIVNSLPPFMGYYVSHGPTPTDIIELF